MLPRRPPALRCAFRTHPAWSWSDGRRCCLHRPDRSGRRRAGCCGTHKTWSGRWAPHGHRWRGRPAPDRHEAAGSQIYIQTLLFTSLYIPKVLLLCIKNPDAFSKAHRAVWSTRAAAVTFGCTFAQPRATYSTHPMPVPGWYAFAHSDNLRAAVLSRSASSLCPPSGKTFPFLYVPPAGEPLFHFPTRLVDWMFALYPVLPSLSIG